MFGRIFLKDEEEECDETFFESSLRKFGIEKVFELIEECLLSDAEWDGAHNGNLPPFMVAASCENCSAASVIYYFLRRNVNEFLVQLTVSNTITVPMPVRSRSPS